MVYMKSAFNYIKDNWLRTMLYCFLPALLLGLISSPVSIIKLLTQTQYNDSVTFSEIFLNTTDFNKPYKIVVMVFAFLVYGIFSSVCVGSIQHKMKYGIFYKNTSYNFFKLVNNYFLPMAKAMLVIMVLMELLGIFTSLFVFFWSKVIPSETITVILCIITTIVFLILFFCTVNLLVLAVPNMTVKGFGLFKSIKVSLEMTIKNFKKILFAVAVPICVAYVPLIVVSVFDIIVLTQVLDILFYLFAFMYYQVLMYVIYFDLDDTQVDNNQINNY